MAVNGHEVHVYLHGDEPIDEEWLEEVGFDATGLHASLVLDNPTGGMVVEVAIFASPDSGGWIVSLLQDRPDASHLECDHVCITSRFFFKRIDLISLLLALGFDANRLMG